MRTFAWAILTPFGLLAAWFGSAFVYETWNTETYRYRLSLKVDVDGEIYTGSGVIQVSMTRKASWIPQTSGTIAGVRREAVAFNLGDRGTLFALLKGQNFRGDADQLLQNALPVPKDNAVQWAEYMRQNYQPGITVRLSPRLYPLLVRFSDISNPKSILLVDPSNLSGSFGPNVSIAEVAVEATDDDITWRLQRILLWLPAWRSRGGTIFGEVIFRGSTPPERLLIPTDFIRE